MELLATNWYIQSPIDFEHKEYLLYAFLQNVDLSYRSKVVSPYLLHLERLRNEMTGFRQNVILIKRDFDKVRYKWFENPKLEGEQNEMLDMVTEIVDFSLPQIETRIELGNKIYKKYNQILW